MAVPLTKTSPEDGVSRPASRPRRVDLPEPEDPMMAANWPLGMAKSRPLRMSTMRAPLRIDLCRPRTAIMSAKRPLVAAWIWTSFWASIKRLSLGWGLRLVVRRVVRGL